MKKLFVFLSAIILLFSCSEDESSNADIVDLLVTDISHTGLSVKDVQIESEFKKVFVFIDNDLSEYSSIKLTTDIKLSPGAKTTSIQNNEIIFSSANEVKTIEIQAEDGTIQEWHMYLIHHQIQNSHFEQWYDNQGMNGENYTEIGSSAIKTVWATANMGTSIYGVYCTQPFMDGSNTLVEIKTGETSQVPVTTGTLFTGIFNLAQAIANPTDPKKATAFGVPFIFRPTAMKFKYKYQAGDTYVQAALNKPDDIFGGFTVSEIDGEDKCSIYTILEIRKDNEVIEVARAEIYSETTADILTEIIIPFDYSSSETPTHITTVFSSSKDGDLWKGAVGSTLTIDDLEFIYE